MRLFKTFLEREYKWWMTQRILEVSDK